MCKQKIKLKYYLIVIKNKLILDHKGARGVISDSHDRTKWPGKHEIMYI